MTEAIMEEFQADIAEWTLIPSDGGRFEFVVDGELLYSKLKTKSHPEADEFREIMREVLGKASN